jgi:hypothetical protein
MPVIKIGRRSIRLDAYVCNGCEIPCVVITHPKPNHCVFGYDLYFHWVKKKMQVDNKGGL